MGAPPCTLTNLQTICFLEMRASLSDRPGNKNQRETQFEQLTLQYSHRGLESLQA